MQISNRSERNLHFFRACAWQSKTYDAENSYFHLLVGTTANRIVEVSFRTDEATNILDLEVEAVVQGHAGSVLAVCEVPSADQVSFVLFTRFI